MAIASMVCGIIGLFGIVSSFIKLLHLFNVRNSAYGIVNYLLIENQISTAIVYLIISFILVILALIFGIIERKKGKAYKYHGMATAGFILGIIGCILLVLPIIFTTGSIITYNIANKGKQSTEIDINSPYLGKQPNYSYYNHLGLITVRTRDFPIGYFVTVDISIGYDFGDTVAGAEFINRREELNDFIRRYFAGKYSVELIPEKEEELKAEFREMLNTRFLDTAKARLIIFNKLEVIEN
jgi:flagellar basal body-associated protein FliL